MKVLVIPDVHLKPWIFDKAIEIMERSDCKRAVVIGDISDDWGMQKDVKLYEETFKKALEFAKKYPDTLWCYGNHDLAYMWDKFDHPGFSPYAQNIVCEYLNYLDETIDLAVMHRMDNVIFSHAGLTKEFADYYLAEYKDDADCLIDAVNGMDEGELWDDISPIWARPQYNHVDGEMYPSGYLQVVGHTPVRSITDQGDLLTVDTFSTDSLGRPIGTEDLCWVDTVTKEWGIIE